MKEQAWLPTQHCPQNDVCQCGSLYSTGCARIFAQEGDRERVCEVAARAGKLEVLQWARTEGCPWEGRICTEAARGEYLLLVFS